MSRTLALLSLTALSFATFACGGSDDDDDKSDADRTESNSPYCEDTETPLAAGESGPTGVSADELLAVIYASYIGEARFAGSVDSGLTVSIVVDPDSVRHVASDAVYPSTGGATEAIGVICDDRVSVDAVVQITTEDGQLAETLTMELSASAYDEGNAPGTSEVLVLGWADIDVDALEGSLDIASFAETSDYDELGASLSVELVGGELFGSLDGQISGADADTAWAMNFPVVSMEAASPEHEPVD